MNPKSARAVANGRRAGGLTTDQKAGLRDVFESVYAENKWAMMINNFLRGIAFGLGTFIGGTIIVALVFWTLSKTVNLFPPIKDFAEQLINEIDVDKTKQRIEKSGLEGN